jgi:cation diffusion facilitator CzcD-associated flavoprotein CzcO
MAGAYMSPNASSADLYAADPTLSLHEPPDTANGPIPDPPIRYGQPLPSEWIPLYRKPMHTPTRKLRVVTIGAGISAMGLAYKFQHEHNLSQASGSSPSGADDTAILEHTIYESNAKVGGTWYVNTYPGVACDVPAHIYTFPFEPNPDWSAYYASGAEILAYFERTVAKYGLDRDVKCGHRVESAIFNEEKGKWMLKVRRGEEEVIEDECDVLISATGFLSKWRWPGIPGLQEFGGHLCHSAVWDGEYDFRGKNVAVIGNGSSAIQIVPQLVGKVGHLTNFVRRPTYITPGLGSAIIGGQAQHVYTEEEKRRFREEPGALHEYRKKIQAGSNRSFDMFVKESTAQKVGRKQTAEMMKARLNNDEDLASKLTPEWEVGCRRATPGPGYLEAFTRDNVSLITSPISKIEKTGIRTEDSTLHPFDAIICATGFDVSHRPPWPLIGLDNLSLSTAWKTEPASYLSLAAAHFPNFFMFSGPNAPVGHGSLMAGLGWSADWMCQWLRKIAAEDIKYVVPKQAAVDEFNAYADEIMQTLVWSGGCQSWYKNHRVDGKVTAVWAGSVIGYKAMVDRIRPEDFEIVYRSRNRFRFMGNGRTRREYDPEADLAFYLHK